MFLWEKKVFDYVNNKQIYQKIKNGIDGKPAPAPISNKSILFSFSKLINLSYKTIDW